MDADELHGKVVEQLTGVLKNEDNLKRLTARINCRLSSPKSDEPQIQSLTRQLAELDQKIQAGADRLLSAPDDVLETLYSQIRKAKEQRRNVESDLRCIKSKTQRKNDKAWTINDVLAAIDNLASQLSCGESKAVHKALKANIERIQLRFRTVQEGKRQIQRLAGGELHLVTERQVAGTGFEPATSRL